VALFEGCCQRVEPRDFRGADGAEILGIKVDDLPFSGEGAFGDVFERRYAVFFSMRKAGLDAGDAKGFQSVAYGLHGGSCDGWGQAASPWMGETLVPACCYDSTR